MCDNIVFMVLIEENQWDDWYTGTLAQADAQDGAEVPDNSYTHANNKKMVLFEETQKFFNL